MTRIAASILLACSLLAAQTPDAQKLFQEAVSAQQRGDDGVALIKYRELLCLHPEAAVVRANLGATLAHLKRYDEAIEQYRLVLAADPHNSHVRLNLALAYEEKGELKRALVELETLQRSQPRDMQTVVMLADCYSRLKRYHDVVRVLSAIQPVHQDDLDLEYLLGSAMIHAGRAEEGAQRIEKVAEKASNSEAYLLAGQARLDLDQYDVAQRDAEAALSLNPALAGAQTLMGMVLEHTGDFSAAEATLRKALQADRKDFDAHLYLGAILYFNRNLEEARLHLERAVQLRPDSPQARYQLALLARRQGRLDQALRELQAVVRQAPNWMQPHVELSALYYRLGRPDDGNREKKTVDNLIAAQHPAPGEAAAEKKGPRLPRPPLTSQVP